MRRVSLLLGLAIGGLFVARLWAQPAAEDPEVVKGIQQVENGEYDAAILTLDAAARRLATDPVKARELSQAYLYLGIAYVGKGHEAAARAKFREAVVQMKDLSLSPEKFPPKVIDLFEAARQEAVQAAAQAAPPTPPQEQAKPKKGGGSKALLIGGGALVVGGGIALAAGGGGGSSGSSATPASPGPVATTTMPPSEPVTEHFEGFLTQDDNAASVGVGPFPNAGGWQAHLIWEPGGSDAIHWFVVNDITGADVGDARPLTENSGVLEWVGAADTRYRVDIFLQEEGPVEITYVLEVTHPR
jgi:hypothetical protein